MIELVEKGGSRLLDLVKIEGGVIVGVQLLYRTWASRLAEGRQAAGGKHGTDNQDIQHCCASRYHLDMLLMVRPPPVSPPAARAASGQAAAPPSSVMNSRRFRSGMGSSPEPAVPAYRKL